MSNTYRKRCIINIPALVTGTTPITQKQGVLSTSTASRMGHVMAMSFDHNRDQFLLAVMSSQDSYQFTLT